jgi:hypothetical protein
MRLLRDETRKDEEKEEAIAVALLETSINTDILEELMLTHKLSVENILAIRNSQNEDKNIVRETKAE